MFFKLYTDSITKLAAGYTFGITHFKLPNMKRTIAFAILTISLAISWFLGPSSVIPTINGTLLLEDRGYFGDGKLLVSNNGAAYLFVTRDGWLRFYSISESLEVPLSEKISAHWLAVQHDPNQQGTAILICAGFIDRAVRVYRITLATGGVSLLKEVVPHDDTLRIDPGLVFYNNRWIATYTELRGIDGATQKRFMVQPLISNDLITWSKLPVALDRAQNLEDVRLYEMSGTLYMLFESEEIDRGPSSLNILLSRDGGESWGSEVSLFKDGSDNEPAGLLFNGGGAELFFSSDMGTGGASYAGAEVYRLKFKDLILGSGAPLLDKQLARLEVPAGVLLIDVVGVPGERGVLSASINDYGGSGAILRVYRFVER